MSIFKVEAIAIEIDAIAMTFFFIFDVGAIAVRLCDLKKSHFSSWEKKA